MAVLASVAGTFYFPLKNKYVQNTKEYKSSTPGLLQDICPALCPPHQDGLTPSHLGVAWCRRYSFLHIGMHTLDINVSFAQAVLLKCMSVVSGFKIKASINFFYF